MLACCKWSKLADHLTRSKEQLLGWNASGSSTQRLIGHTLRQVQKQPRSTRKHEKNGKHISSIQVHNTHVWSQFGLYSGDFFLDIFVTYWYFPRVKLDTIGNTFLLELLWKEYRNFQWSNYFWNSLLSPGNIITSRMDFTPSGQVFMVFALSAYLDLFNAGKGMKSIR